MVTHVILTHPCERITVVCTSVLESSGRGRFVRRVGYCTSKEKSQFGGDPSVNLHFADALKSHANPPAAARATAALC